MAMKMTFRLLQGVRDMASINSRAGKLYIDFRYFGKRCREMTLLEDTKPNRKRLENFVTKLEAEISLGTFH